MTKEIHELFRLARGTAALKAALLGGDARALATGGLRARFPDFAARFERFIADHGHREPDPDPREPMWADAPWAVLETVMLLLRREHVEDPFVLEMDAKSAQHRAELAAYAVIPEDLHLLLGEVVRVASAYSALDDIEHYPTTRLYHLFRTAVRHIGQHLVTAGLAQTPGVRCQQGDDPGLVYRAVVARGGSRDRRAYRNRPGDV